jgi:hypothetical protein
MFAPDSKDRWRPTTLSALWQFAATAVLALGGVCAGAKPAHAYTIQSEATEGCHEKVTREAWQNVRTALPTTTGPLPSSGDDKPLIDDLAFDVPKSLRDIGSVTLLLGVRDNDVKQHGPNDLRNLSPVASDPNLQPEHCLRAPDQDEPDGSRLAVDACRAYIREQLVTALDGLDASGRPDAQKREKLSVALAIRGTIDVSVPLFFLHAGRGLHALEDSFTHTFRNPDEPGKIRVVLNFVEYSEDRLNEAVDGPPHASELDVCNDPDELRTKRHQLAVEAGSHALTALLDPKLSRSAKERAIDQVLDDYVSYDTKAHCTADNHWCDAPELVYGSPTLGCSAVPGALAGGAGLAGLFGAVALALLGGARRWRRRAAATSLLALLVLLASPARAEDSTKPSSPATSDSSITHAPVTPPDKPGAFFGRVALGASYDHPAFSGGAGLRYQLAEKWMLGFDAEWNPYFAVTPQKVRAGSANAYFSVIRRYQLVRASVNIRTTASVGGSMLLFDLVGADKYSFGPFLGVSFLGAEWKAARGVYLTIDPTYIALPVPSVTGIPFMYVQYRFLLGLELGA